MARVSRDFLYPNRQPSFSLYWNRLKNEHGLSYYPVDLDGVRVDPRGHLSYLLEFRTNGYAGAKPAMDTIELLARKVRCKFIVTNGPTAAGEDTRYRIYVAGGFNEIHAVFCVVNNEWPKASEKRYRLWPGPSTMPQTWPIVERACAQFGIQTGLISLLSPGGIPDEADADWLLGLGRPLFVLEREQAGAVGRSQPAGPDATQVVLPLPAFGTPTGNVRRLVLTASEAIRLMGFKGMVAGAPGGAVDWIDPTSRSQWDRLLRMCQDQYAYEPPDHVVYLDQTYVDYGITWSRSAETGQRQSGGYQGRFPHRAAAPFTQRPAKMPLFEEGRP